MKKLFVSILCGYLLIATSVSAQKKYDKMLPVVTITASSSSVAERVKNAFSESFKDAQNMKWYQANKNYLVKFIMEDQEHQALYRKDGSLIYHVSYGFEKDLPMVIKNQVNSKYKNYKISRIFNVNQDNRNVWVVNLQSEKDMILTRVEDGVLNEVSRVKNIGLSTDMLSKTNSQQPKNR